VQRLQSLLPIRTGDKLSEDQESKIHNEINRAVERAVGHPPTDIAFVCCNNQGNFMLFIGLGGKNSASIAVHHAPDDSGCLPRHAMTLYDEAMAAVPPAVQRGNGGEDDSRGYSLSNDPVLRSKQIAMHEYAIGHEQTLERALQTCRQPQDRRAAAEILGYGRRSARQIGGLVCACRDPDGEVRNNALRALWVLAIASPGTGAQISAKSFVEMLNSGVWEDRNKAGLLLMALTRSRNPRLLHQLRTEALPSLIEMARWQDPSHAYPYRVILGRIAGFSEAQVQRMVGSGKVRQLIAGAKGQSMRRTPRGRNR
jgi:hypothetical protein